MRGNDVTRRVRFWWWALRKAGVKEGQTAPGWAMALRAVLTPVEFVRKRMWRGNEWPNEIRIGRARWSLFVLERMLRPDPTSWFQIQDVDKDGRCRVLRVSQTWMERQQAAHDCGKDHDHDHDRG